MMIPFRIGHGYDVHRLAPGRRLVLGGVEIPWQAGLLGHSDADVLAHAVIDSILGAAAMGDIGQMFPDSDGAFKDADSMALLEKAANAVCSRGFKVVNLDATIIAQRPKLAEYIGQMRKNIADRLGMGEDCVSVKATTEEGLGFTGGEEGMAAHCVCMLEKL